MTPRDALGTQRRWRLWNSRLWILAAALGAVTIFSTAATIHDTRQLRQAAHVVLVATGERIAERATNRLLELSLSLFAPALAAPASESRSAAVLAAIVRRQRAGVACRCQRTLPARELVRFDIATDSVTVRVPVDDGHAGDTPVTGLLTELLRRDAARPRVPRAEHSRLVFDPRLRGSALLDFVVRDSTGQPVGVLGTLLDARALAALLFAPEIAPLPAGGSFQLARLDSLSLRVSTTDSTVLFGALDPQRRHLRVDVITVGVLDGLVIAVALDAGQVAFPISLPVPVNELWHLGALLAATILVIGVAVGAARREALLARSRSDFVAGVSHDLRMPLAQILLAGETLALQRERDPSERVTFASSIVREARRLVALVDNVLLFARSGSVELHPRLSAVAVDALFADVVDAVQLSVDDAGQRLERGDAAGVAVAGDRALVRQALVNLVDNALKYGAAGQEIRLSAVLRSSRVQLIVDDEGPGVPLAERRRVFDAYERLDRDQVSERTGSGLGLAVVRQIALACNGAVWLEEAPGGGTRAVLELQVAGHHRPSPLIAGVA